MRVNWLHSARRTGRLFSLLLVVVLVAACGADTAREEPTPVPTTAPPPTAAPGEATLGDLLAEVEKAWPTVTSMRTTSISGPVPSDSSNATAPAGSQSTIEEVVAPNNRRIVLLNDNVPTDEQIYVDGKVYMWGTFVANAVAPEVGAGTWITVDPSVIPADTPVGYQLAYLMRPFAPPTDVFSPDIQARPVTAAGKVDVGGRTCTVYTFVDATQSGARIDYELALDEHNLPCQAVQRAGGFQNSSVFEINVPDLHILAPDTPTPVSGTPEG